MEIDKMIDIVVEVTEYKNKMKSTLIEISNNSQCMDFTIGKMSYLIDDLINKYDFIETPTISCNTENNVANKEAMQLIFEHKQIMTVLFMLSDYINDLENENKETIKIIDLIIP